MDPYLLELLRNTHDSSSKEFTHLTFYGPNNRWSIPHQHYQNFWKKYCQLVCESEDNKLCLAELPSKEMPLIMDFTFRFHPLAESNNELNENYSVGFIQEVISCLQEVMLDNLQISDSRMELICCVLESENYMDNNLIISKFKLQFPYCKTLPTVQNRNIRPEFIKALRTKNVISELNQQPINDWETIIDPLSSEKPVPLYGSSFNSEVPAPKLEYIFYKLDDNEGEMELEDAFKIENHVHVQTGIVKPSIFLEAEDDGEDSVKRIDHDYWLPMFLSIHYYPGITLPKTKINSLKPEVSIHLDKNPDDITDQEMAEIFLSMLSIDRVEMDNYWLDVGKSLFGTFEGDLKGLELWSNFTEKSDKHTPEECDNLYMTFQGTPMTVKTLAWYARIDSPKLYDQWHKSWYTPALEKATSCLDADVAKALYRVYWLDFACSNLTKSHLYHFKNHIWKKLDNGHVLRKYISGDFISILEKFRTVISLKIQDSTDKNFKESAEMLVKKATNLICKLKKRTFKNNILSESLELFHVEEFNEKLDSNPDLMGFCNGITEAGETEVVFRDGKPEDYVSKSSGLICRKDLHWKHPLVIKLLEWLTKVFPDKKLLDYFGKISASCLKGKNSDKLFPVMTGRGDNSKSMIKKLFECSFGAYCITFPTTLFTSNRSGGGPDPAVARSKYAHIAFAQEPDADAPLKNGTIKEMTGGDRFFARFLNDNGGEIEPMFTLILMCNTVPIIPHSDRAMKNRVRLVPYLSTWVSNPPKTRDEQFRKRKFKKDPFFEKQIPDLAPAFMWYLIQMYAKYRKEGLIEPELVTESTSEYWNENDIYLQFISENLEKAYQLVPNWPENKPKPVDEGAKITVANMYSRFRDWFRECFNGLKCPDRPLVKQELENRMGKTYQRSWKGIKFKVNLADIPNI